MSDVALVLKSEQLTELLAAEAHHSDVYTPVRTNGEVEFRAAANGDKPQLVPGPSRSSPKQFFFPQTETLYRFDFDTVESTDGNDENEAVRPALLFAVRPCDAASFLLLDQVFGPSNHGYPDPYYETRREDTVVVTLACSTPCTTCFCTSVGGDPADSRGADVLAFELDGKYLFEAKTERGEAFLTRHDSLLEEAKPADLDAAESLASAAREAVPATTYDRETAKKNLDDRFDDPVWERITNSCIGCGACTYLCPTCHCFDICDEQRHYKGKRIRTWDSCQFAQFTEHASGHNPRPSKIQRLRQRFMHKFSYTVESVNEVYCVGCGRCVKYCPVNLDIREVLREFSV